MRLGLESILWLYVLLALAIVPPLVERGCEVCESQLLDSPQRAGIRLSCELSRSKAYGSQSARIVLKHVLTISFRTEMPLHESYNTCAPPCTMSMSML